MRLVVGLSVFNSIYYHCETYCVNWIKERDFRLVIEIIILLFYFPRDLYLYKIII